METKEEKMEQGVTHLRPGRRTPVLSLHLRGGTRVAEPVPTQQRAGCLYSPGCREKIFSKTGLPLLLVPRELRGHEKSRGYY